jgi:type I restriction enzyme S subunit
MRSNAWTKAKLGDVLRRVERFEPRNELTDYPFAGTYSFGRGIFVGERKLGSTFALPKVQRIHAGDFIYCKIMAWEGAFGIVPKEADNCVMSGAFMVYELNRERIDEKFLDYFFKVPVHWQRIGSQSTGTNVRRQSLHPGQFERAEIPLPPLAEQRRIVTRIEQLAAQIDEACTLRRQAVEEAEALLVAMAHRADLNADAKRAMGWKMKRLNDVIHFVDDSHKVTPDRSYPNLGIYSFGRGLFHKPAIDGLATSAKSLRRVKAGQFIYSRLFAFEGAYGMVMPEFDGFFVSQEYPTFDCDPKFVRAEFLAAYFKPRHVWATVAEGSKGLGDRRQRIQPPQILSHELWLPPVDWQNRIAEVQAEVDALNRMQAKTAAELDALLPSILDKAFKGEL